MFLINCPHCGPRSQAEFVYERVVDAVAHPDASTEVAVEALYTRANARGFTWELWRHAYGCRGWIRLLRHSVTHEISEIQAVGSNL
jgi:sarcosine oxidase subunit delta